MTTAPREQPNHFQQIGSTRFYIDRSLPLEILDAIIPTLEKHGDKIPHWCRRVAVYWSESEGESQGAVTIVPRYDYRRAELTIRPNFLSQPSRRELNIVHELMHLYTEPLANAAADARDALKKVNEGVAAIVDEAIRHGGEQTVVDLTELLIGTT